jgi:putative ABC transport system permease protein
MNLSDTTALAYRTIKGNKLRTSITIAIIALGIAALIGINTAISAMSQKFLESFSSMGANGFSIRTRQWEVRFGRSSAVKQYKNNRRLKKSNTNKPIKKREAELFKENYKYPATVGISLGGGGGAVIGYGNKKTNPTVRINGGDENYVTLNSFNIQYGRNISAPDVTSGSNVCLVGRDVAVKLFGENTESGLDKIVRINNISFRVIGLLEPKGSTFGQSLDNMVITTYNNVGRFFNTNSNASYSIGVKIGNVNDMDVAIGEAAGVLRGVRKVSTLEDDNFIIDKSDSIVELLLKQIGWLTGAAVIIGFITLIGAAIGLMNIMLVAVSERTREVGLVKAIGGKRKNIRQQFLIEAILISLFGAFFGIVAGIFFGNIVSVLMNTGFVVPWGWVIAGVIICTIVGLVAGSYPAYKASRLNPIEALRYE